MKSNIIYSKVGQRQWLGMTNRPNVRQTCQCRQQTDEADRQTDRQTSGAVFLFNILELLCCWYNRGREGGQ